MATLILKKPTPGDFFISDVGIVIPGSGQDTFTESELIRRLTTSNVTRSAVTGGTLVVNDGTSDLSPTAGIEYLEQLWVKAGYTTTGVLGTQGPQGNQGPSQTGTQGSQGPQGVSGTGTQGAQGFQGADASGVQGPQGIVGSQGSQGASEAGVQGPQGDQGFQGFQGTNPGSQGPQGNQGEMGAGFQGPQGNQGFQGTNPGPQGSQGPQGEIGFQGNQGISGAGVQGAQGIQGVLGPQGFQGANRAKYLFGNTSIVPSGGTLQLEGPGTAIQGYRLPRGGTITAASVQVNTTSANGYDLDMRVNGVSAATLPLAAGTLGNSTVAPSVPVSANDILTAFLVRTSGSGGSTFNEMLAVVEVTES